MPILLELKLIAVLALIVGALLGYQHFVNSEQAKGYAKRAAEDAVATAKLQAQLDSQQKAWQAKYDQEGEAYEQALAVVEHATSAQSAVADGLRHDITAIGQRAGNLSKAPGDACRTQDEQLARGAELFSACLGLASEGAGLAQRLDAKVTALQRLSP